MRCEGDLIGRLPSPVSGVTGDVTRHPSGSLKPTVGAGSQEGVNPPRPGPGPVMGGLWMVSSGAAAAAAE